MPCHTLGVKPCKCITTHAQISVAEFDGRFALTATGVVLLRPEG
jgi:hypothetical protein